MLTSLLTLVAALPAADLPDTGDLADGWVTEVAYQASDKLGACAVGELDSEHEGLEVVTVCRTGHVFLLLREGDSWTPRILGKTPGEMIQVTIADVLPDRPGLEVACVGAAEGFEADERPGQAWVFHREGRGWRSQAAYRSSKLLHAVTLLDGELLVGGYDLELLGLRPDRSGWGVRTLGALPGPAKNGLTLGERSYFACQDGSLVTYGPSHAIEVLQRGESGHARLGSDGQRLVVCDDGGTLSLVDFDGRAEVVYREGDKLRGAVIADLDPRVPGPELATVGYERRLTILTLEEGEWRPTPVLRESEKFHGLAAGDLDGDGDAELVACGYSGRLIVVDRFVR